MYDWLLLSYFTQVETKKDYVIVQSSNWKKYLAIHKPNFANQCDSTLRGGNLSFNIDL